jgi:DNA-dependent metalloprotease WSS1
MKFLWQAAERRLRDEKSCGSGPAAQREAEKAAKESTESKVIDLTLDDFDDYMYDLDSDSEVIIVENVHREPPRSSSAAGSSSVPQKISNPTGSSSSRTNKYSDVNSPFTIPIRKSSSRQPVEWSCQACTLSNPYTALQCEACDMRRPPDKREGWTCATCFEPGISHDFWTCPWCGTVKVQS